MRHLGIHWPNGPVNPEDIGDWGGALIRYPGSFTVIGSESAVWWYWDILKVRQDMLPMWRHVPLPEYRPAKLDYNAQRYVAHLKEQIDRGLNLPKNRSEQPPKYIIVGNEFNLNYERGDDEDDWSDLEDRYRRLNDFLVEVFHRTHIIYPNSKLVFPAWSPEQRVHEHVDLWRPAADLYHVYLWHAYASSNQSLVDAFSFALNFKRENWIEKDHACGEHHGNTTIEEANALIYAHMQIESDPTLLGFCRFIWKWYDNIGQWDIHNNLEMMDLYSSPSYTDPNPEPVPTDPIPDPPSTSNYDPSTAHVIAQGQRAADANGIPRQLLLGLGWAESGWRGNAERWGRITDRARAAIVANDVEALYLVFETVEANWPGDISFGPYQPTWRWRDTDEFVGAAHNDLNAILQYRIKYFDVPYASDRGARRIKGFWNRYKPDMLEALCRYNKPSMPGVSNPARAHYAQGLAEALKVANSEQPPMALVDAGKIALWRLYLPDLMYQFDPGNYTGFFNQWIPNEWGSPITDEYTAENGRPRQAFANGIYEWQPTGAVKVL